MNLLKEKIKPYLEKTGGEACKYLKDNPLNLNEKEVNFLNKVAHEDVLTDAIEKYERFAVKPPKDFSHNPPREYVATAPKKFTNLTQQQQTALISNTYQYGSPKPSLLVAIATGDRTKIPATREHDYLFNSMPAP